MELLHAFLATSGSILVLFILTKIMGNRQMSQLSLFDYIIGITIGSIASEMAIAPEDVRKPLLAMIVYGLVATLISTVSCKSAKLRTIITGKPLLLYENGKFYVKNLFKAKLDVGEFLTQCRNSGYFNLNAIHTALLEPNGKISFIPYSTQRPVNPGDLNLSPQQEGLVTNVIVDGKKMIENMNIAGIGDAWLQEQLNNQGVKDISEVFLATCDTNHTINVYKGLGSKNSADAIG